MKRHPLVYVVASLSVLVTVVGIKPAAARIIRSNAGGGGIVSLPHAVPDSAGNPWTLYQSGWLQVQGNQPLYSQGAMLMINGNQPGQRNNQAKLDEKTGEVIFENLTSQGFTITRRILINKEEAYARYIDIIKNTQGQDQVCNLQIQTNLNFGVDAGQNISDTRKKDQTIGWTAQNGNGRAIVEMFAGKGSKLTPTVNFQQGNTFVQGIYAVPVPAGKEVAIMHLHGIVNTTEDGTKFVQQLRESKLLGTLPPELRRMIVNFNAGQGYIGDRELLRGDLFDIVETRGGDQIKGTLKEPGFSLTTFYGKVELPASRVVGLINVGEFRPRQLVITTDGEIFGGKLSKDTLDLQLSSGQVTQVPLSQVARVGYRKRADEPEEWSFDKPFVSLRSGDRMAVQMPENPIEIVTRYGLLKLDPKAISAIVFQSEEHGVHEIQLTDGSKFAGLVSAPIFDMKLSGGGSSTQPAEGEQVVHFPASVILHMQFALPPEEPDDSESPTLELMNDDVLVGALTGQLKLDTAFDTLTLAAGEIKKLARTKDSGLDVQVTLWDSSVVSGQLEEPAIQCQLNSGVTVAIPLALLEEYNHPSPQPAAAMIDKIKAIVADLNAEDWKQRDRAEAELTTMGTSIIGVLKQMRSTQPPEAQQRIDHILAALSAKKKN